MDSVSFSDDEINFSSNENNDAMQEADTYLISPMVLAVTSRGKTPPQLIDFAGQNKEMQLIANNLHQLFTAPGFYKYSTETRKNLELVLRSFIADSILSSNFKEGDMELNQTEMKKIQSELFETRKELENYKFLAKEAVKSKNDLQNENKELQDEIDSLYRDNATTLNQLNSLKRERDIQLVEIKNENDQLKEKLKEIQDDFKIKEFAEKRNEAQFVELTSQAANRGSKLIKLEEKVKEKDEVIQDLQTDIQSMKIKIQSLEDDNNQLSAYLSTTKANLNTLKKKFASLSKGRKHDSGSDKSESSVKIHQAFQALTEQFERQNEELVQLRQNQMMCTTLLHQQLEMITEYEKITLSTETLRDKNYELTNQLNSIKSELIQVKEKYSKKNDLIKNLISLTEAESEDNLSLTVMKMKEFGCMENKRLVAAFEDQLRFMIGLVNSDVLYGQSNTPLNEDSSFKDKLQVEISRCKQFILENTIENSPSKNSNPNNDSEEDFDFTGQRNDFAILSTQVLRNEILRKYSQKLKQESTVLHKAAEIVGCADDPTSLCEIIQVRNNSIRSFVEDAMNAIKIEQSISYTPNEVHAEEEQSSQEPTDVQKCFEKILDSLEMNNAIFADLKTILKFSGTINEIPAEVEKIVRNNNSNIRMNNSPHKHHSNSNSHTSPNSNSGSPSNSKSKINDDNASKSLDNTQEENNNNTNDRTEILPSTTDNVDLSPRTTEILIPANEQSFDSFQLSPKTAKLESKLSEYQNAVKKLKKDNLLLKKALNEYKNKVSEAEKRDSSHKQTLSAMKHNYAEVESRCSELSSQNAKLEQEMEEKVKAADARIYKVVDQERAQHAIEIENIQNRFNVLSDRLKERLNNKKQRIQTLKKKLKDVISSYEEAFRKQKSTISILREQLEEQAKEANQSEISLELAQMDSQLRATQSEKNNLEMKIKQIQDDHVKAMTIRDTFWKAQIALVEQTAQKNIDNEKQSIITNIASKIKCNPTLEDITKAYEKKFNDNSTSDFSKSVSIDTQAQKQLEEWEKWSRSLFTNVSHGEVFGHNSKELRFILGEMVLSSISNHILISRLESLRIQKIYLISRQEKYVPRPKKKSPPEIRSLLLCSMFLIRIQRRINRLTPRLFQTYLSPTH